MLVFFVAISPFLFSACLCRACRCGSPSNPMCRVLSSERTPDPGFCGAMKKVDNICASRGNFTWWCFICVRVGALDLACRSRGCSFWFGKKHPPRLFTSFSARCCVVWSYDMIACASLSAFFGPQSYSDPTPIEGHGGGPSSKSGAEHSHHRIPGDALEEAIPGNVVVIIAYFGIWVLDVLTVHPVPE